MSAAELIRWGSTPMGTFGVLRLGGHEWYSVERPWAQNKPEVSCIPAGWYPIRRGMYYGGDGVGGKEDYPAYEITGVPYRSQIKIHRLKYGIALALKGCVCLGKDLGIEGNRWAVRRCAEAYEEWMRAADEIKPDHIGVMWAAVEPSI